MLVQLARCQQIREQHLPVFFQILPAQQAVFPKGRLRLLRRQQIRDLRKVLPCEAVVYGRLPLMIMENCVIRNELGCRDAGRDYTDRSPACRCGQENVLVDRTGAQFPLVGQWGHRCEIENSKVLFLADKPEWRQLGLTRARLRFTTESPEECVRVLRAYQGRSDYRPDQLTRGLFYRGVE